MYETKIIPLLFTSTFSIFFTVSVFYSFSPRTPGRRGGVHDAAASGPDPGQALPGPLPRRLHEGAAHGSLDPTACFFDIFMRTVLISQHV